MYIEICGYKFDRSGLCGIGMVPILLIESCEAHQAIVSENLAPLHHSCSNSWSFIFPYPILASVDPKARMVFAEW
jgi:hypothetical protein